jgi:transposase
VARVPVDKRVTLDETGTTTAMTRLFGRAPPGERVVDAVPQNNWQMTTVIGAMRIDGMAAAMITPGATDTTAFLAFVEQVLMPALRPGEVVLMDNLRPHHAPGVQEAIARAGARVLYLPPYSPDFNPIEPCWSKVKASLRKTAARTPETLNAAIAQALHTITADDCKGYFKHCGPA